MCPAILIMNVSLLFEMFLLQPSSPPTKKKGRETDTVFLWMEFFLLTLLPINGPPD